MHVARAIMKVFTEADEATCLIQAAGRRQVVACLRIGGGSQHTALAGLLGRDRVLRAGYQQLSHAEK
jgi:hypothetical protein